MTYCGKTGMPVGIFGACHHLKRAGKLSLEEVQLFEEIDAWYTERLPEPPFYRDGNPQKAITWFKDTETVRELVQDLDPLIALLEKHGVNHLTTRETEPGMIIYEDEFQIATVQEQTTGS